MGHLLWLELEGAVGPGARSLAGLERYLLLPLIQMHLSLYSASLWGRWQLFSSNWETSAKFHQLRNWLLFCWCLCPGKMLLCYLCEMGGNVGTSSLWYSVKFSKCQIYFCMWWCNLASCCANERINFRNIEINSAVDISPSCSTN